MYGIWVLRMRRDPQENAQALYEIASAQGSTLPLPKPSTLAVPIANNIIIAPGAIGCVLTADSSVCATIPPASART
jgi:hypothetical protein